MWADPKIVAQGVYNSATPIERTRIKDNLNNYGNAIFKQFKYSKEQEQEFIAELRELLNKE